MNDSGELGDGTTTNRSTPTQVGTATTWQRIATGATHTIALRTDGSLWAWGNDYSGQFGDDRPWHTAIPLLIYALTLTATRPSATGPGLSLVPNPAHDHIELPDWPSDTRLVLFDAQGRRVRTGQGPRLSLQDLNPGLYLLRAAQPGQPARTARLLRE